MTRQTGLNPTAGTLLGLLAERPMTGWELVDETGVRVGNFWTIQRSQAYRELAQLAANGHVEALPEEARHRRPYRITDAGRAAYLEWLQEMPADESVRVPFLLKVAFMDDMPRERFDELLAAQRRRHAERLTRYEQNWRELHGDDTVRGGPRLATLALGIAYERSTLGWLDELPGFFEQQTRPDVG
ncbi:PadR family transcriptional regulator [Paramicrobacterium chengjingii]|uniref:PadR family transcriptional regulator n=1 Tax=Paramicrobacterium chengjingii TaxID=2769067 RepID=A0ABX6YIN6_9MICO|nr:PadR family transcriptional regulator [Microbacterium chengjingii]QPZ38485.1 PadR family transcriptional regulator [Microbacterium chengjingii]